MEVVLCIAEKRGDWAYDDVAFRGNVAKNEACWGQTHLEVFLFAMRLLAHGRIPGLLKKKASPRCTYHGSYRLIHHLSHPAGSSTNDNIPEDLCTVQYQTIENAIAHIRALGQGCFMAKTDIAEAFRIIPILPAQYQLFGLCWRGQYYYDKCLAMGCSSSRQIFEHLSSALQWIATHKLDIQYISHVLDDFIISNNAYDCCKAQLQQFLHMCSNSYTLGTRPWQRKKHFYPHRYSHFWVMS